MTKQQGKRKVVAVSLTPEDDQRVSQECRSLKVSKMDFLASLIQWYMKQDEVTRLAVLGRLPKSVERDVARIVLEKMRDGKA